MCCESVVRTTWFCLRLTFTPRCLRTAGENETKMAGITTTSSVSSTRSANSVREGVWSLVWSVVLAFNIKSNKRWYTEIY
jgi:hypothetical protein